MKPKPNDGTVVIHDKVYETVALRVKKFREAHPLWTLQTEILSRDADVVVMLAKIIDENGRLIANGHSEEKRNASQINRTSALENAETSAIGRALAALGLGGQEFATANEVQNAILQQKNPDELPPPPPLTAEQKINVENIASRALDFINAGELEKAYDWIDQNKLEEMEEKLYLWSFFDSKMKTALKKIDKVKHPFNKATGTYDAATQP